MTRNTLPNLADVSFGRERPGAKLAPFIQWYWQMSAAKGNYQPRQEFIHANGSTHIAFNFGHALQLDKGAYSPGTTIVPPSINSRRLTLEGNVSCFGVLLQPGASYSLLNIPAMALNDLAIEAYPAELRRLGESLANLPSFERRIVVTERVLLSLLQKSNHTVPKSISASLPILRSIECFSIKDLTERLNVSQRQLERHFRDHMGISAKQYSRAMRIHHARHLLKQNPSSKLIDIAIQAGYFDQSHFHRDFCSAVGMTPRKYRDRSKP